MGHADTHGGDAYVNMGPEQLVYVYLWVDVPAVENGEPLADRTTICPLCDLCA